MSFKVLEVIKVILIAALVAFVGWEIWVSQTQTRPVCEEPEDTKFKLYTTYINNIAWWCEESMEEPDVYEVDDDEDLGVLRTLEVEVPPGENCRLMLKGARESI